MINRLTSRVSLAIMMCGAAALQAQPAASASTDNSPTLLECSRKEGQPDQLDCFKKHAAAVLAKEKEAKDKEEKLRIENQQAFVRKWKVRDSSTISASGDYDIGSKPASIQLGTSEGSSISSVKASVFGVLQPFKSGPLESWEPFFSIGWDRDISAKTPKDLRQFVVGMEGNAFDGASDKSQLYFTLRGGHRNDTRADSKSWFANANVDIYYLPWVEGARGKDLNYKAIYFPAGLVVEDVRLGAPTPGSEGRRSSIYLGAKFEADLHAVLPRLSANARAQWFGDFDAPAGSGKRRQRFVTVGLNYDLVDPKAKKGWVPSLTLSRQVGTDPVTGEGPIRKTVLGLGIKFD